MALSIRQNSPSLSPHCIPGCKAFADAYDLLGKPASSVLQENFSTATHQLADAANDFHDWTGKCGYAVAANNSRQAQFLSDVGRSQASVEHALAMAAGLHLTAEADTGDLAPGNTFHVAAHSNCRKQADCTFTPITLGVPPLWQQTAVEGDISKGFKFTLTLTPKLPPPNPNKYLLPNPPDNLAPLLPEPPSSHRSPGNPIAGYKMALTEPVTYVQATSTNVLRVPLRIVPDYTLSVDPSQFVAVLNAPHKPFDVFLRVHSYSEKPAKVSIGLDVPDGITASAPVALNFTGIGDQYAKLTVTPPAKLDAGNFTITAYAIARAKNSRLHSIPFPRCLQFLERPAQSVVHAFDINVPPVCGWDTFPRKGNRYRTLFAARDQRRNVRYRRAGVRRPFEILGNRGGRSRLRIASRACRSQQTASRLRVERRHAGGAVQSAISSGTDCYPHRILPESEVPHHA